MLRSGYRTNSTNFLVTEHSYYCENGALSNISPASYRSLLSHLRHSKNAITNLDYSSL
uniref:Uncharacterized protein n=1 Tax=Anguilla anguilla TaxID=7936 RepID=A0A0E9P526_ANGAN